MEFQYKMLTTSKLVQKTVPTKKRKILVFLTGVQIPLKLLIQKCIFFYFIIKNQ